MYDGQEGTRIIKFDNKKVRTPEEIFNEQNQYKDQTGQNVEFNYLNPDMLAAQDAMDATIDAVSALIATVPAFGRTSWSAPLYDHVVDAIVAQSTVEIGREDFGGGQYT